MSDALSIALDTDERGFELAIETDDGVHRFNVHAEIDTLIEIGQRLSDYLDEGRRAAASYIPPARESDLDGYDLGDPKRITLARENQGNVIEWMRPRGIRLPEEETR